MTSKKEATVDDEGVMLSVLSEEVILALTAEESERGHKAEEEDRLLLDEFPVAVGAHVAPAAASSQDRMRMHEDAMEADSKIRKKMKANLNVLGANIETTSMHSAGAELPEEAPPKKAPKEALPIEVAPGTCTAPVAFASTAETTHTNTNNLTRPRARPQTTPGAVSVQPSNNIIVEDEEVSERTTTQNAPTEQLFSATLVNDHHDLEQQNLGHVVEAHPAPKGFRAIVANKRFKYLMASFSLLLIVATVTPLALLIPETGKPPEQTTVIINRLDDCGSRGFKQADYRGDINVTETGKPCQPWDSQLPHSHTLDSQSDPSLQSNYCRNPGREQRAWCFTSDPSVRMEFCSVPYCDEDDAVEITHEQCGTTAVRQQDYRGTVNVTATGRTCQRWDSQLPHRHELTPDSRPSAGLEDNNYCRNPDGKYFAYCFTTDPDVEWEYCDIPPCGAPALAHNETCQGDDCTKEQCGTVNFRQVDYRGTINVTESGIPCQRWDAMEPHEPHFTPQDYPNDGLVENYCRNPSPDWDDRAWCYTTDPEKRWEFCEVPFCKKPTPRRQCGSMSLRQADYKGDITVTESGKECVEWNRSPNAVLSGFVQAQHPHAGLIGNYCRNPMGSERARAFCYTDELDMSWEFCPVPACQECGTEVLNKTDYRGNVAVSISGQVCEDWSQFQMPEAEEWGLEGNFCRNPGGVRGDVWCYVNSSHWEFCDVPVCVDELDFVTHDDCGSPEHKQADYRGPINTTVSGEACQPWTSQEPHPHKLTPEERPLDGLEGNACRNPDGSDRAWCFTTNPDLMWECCNVTECS